VYQVHDWAKVRELYHQGVSKKAIARRLGMSRNTVARLTASETPPCYERAAAGSLLDPFKDAVAAMLTKDAEAPATVIRQYLQRQGYAGGITILKDYLALVRPASAAARRCPTRGRCSSSSASLPLPWATPASGRSASPPNSLAPRGAAFGCRPTASGGSCAATASPRGRAVSPCGGLRRPARARTGGAPRGAPPRGRASRGARADGLFLHWAPRRQQGRGLAVHGDRPGEPLRVGRTLPHAAQPRRGLHLVTRPSRRPRARPGRLALGGGDDRQRQCVR